MDELTALRDTRSDVPPPSQEALDRGRAALFAKIGEAAAPAARPVVKSRRRRWIASTSAATAAVAAVLLVANLTGVGGSGQSAAAEVLHQTAEATISTADPVVPAGSFLKVATSAVYSTTSGHVSYLTIATDELYVPADRGDDWVWVRNPSVPYKTFGPSSEASAENAKPGEAEIVRAAAGGFYSAPSTSSADAFAKLPRDPDALLAYIHQQTRGQGNSVDSAAFGYVADRLTNGLAPANLRAALYETAALIPGVTVENDHATLNGATGVAIGRTDEKAGTRNEIIVDPRSGALVGQREVLTSDQSGMPAGTATTWTAKTTSVVSSAPAGGTPNGAFDDMGCTVTGPDSFQC